MIRKLIDCRYFHGDRPCFFHKERGIKCNNCSYYAPINNKVLIIKLGAPGDVLRTTPILRAIKHEIPDAHITWLTDNASIPLLEANPFIDRIWECSSNTIGRLLVEEFDLILALDNSGDCASLATLTKARKKLGFGMTANGSVVPLNPEAETWLEMAALDDIKKANKRTYCDNPLRTFIAKMDACNIIVTADTLALHIAVGLKKYVVALFGPTSSAEIELYGRGTKIVAHRDYVCCYRL